MTTEAETSPKAVVCTNITSVIAPQPPSQSSAALARKRRRQKMNSVQASSVTTATTVDPTIGAPCDALNGLPPKKRKVSDASSENLSATSTDNPAMLTRQKQQEAIPMAVGSSTVSPTSISSNDAVVSVAGRTTSSISTTGTNTTKSGKTTKSTARGGKGKKVRTQMRYDPDVPMTKEEAAIWRREARRVRNRESAAASRRKIRERIEELESEVELWKSKYEEAIQKLKEKESLTVAATQGNTAVDIISPCASPILSSPITAHSNNSITHQESANSNINSTTCAAPGALSPNNTHQSTNTSQVVEVNGHLIESILRPAES